MLAKWDKQGKLDEPVLRDPNNLSLNDEWFGTKDRPDWGRIQTTWGEQIRVLLSMQGLPCGTEDVRQYQMNAFGLKKGETCLMEMLPLPNPGVGDWVYSDLTDDPNFSSRDVFTKHVLNSRISRFLELVKLHRLTAVIGVYYEHGKLLELYFEDVEYVQANSGNRPGRVVIENISTTVVAITYHPNYSMTVPNAWYEELGQIVTARSDSQKSNSCLYCCPCTAYLGEANHRAELMRNW